MTHIIKTEHAGAKNGGGYFGKREEAKRISRERRRMADKRIEREATLVETVRGAQSRTRSSLPAESGPIPH